MSKKLIYNGEDKFKKRVAELLENGSGASKLTELQDVAISNPQDNQVLKYNGSDWVNGKASDVEANPQEATEDTLYSVKIDGRVYDFENPSGQSGRTVKLIYKNISSSNPSKVTYTNMLEEFDDIELVYYYTGDSTKDAIISSYNTKFLKSYIGKSVAMYGYGNRYLVFKVTDRSTLTFSTSNEYILLNVYGIKYILSDGNITSALSDMTDVNIQNPLDSQILQYDSESGKWINVINEGATTEIALIPPMTSATTPSGEATASFSHSSLGAPWKAFDSTNTSDDDGWVTDNARVVGEWIQYKFDKKQVANKLYIENRTDNSDSVCRPVKDFELYGGDTESSLVLLGTFENTKTGRSEGTYYTFKNTTSYLIYRIKILSTNDPDNRFVGFGKIQLYLVSGKTESIYTAGNGINISDDNEISTKTRIVDIKYADYNKLSEAEKDDESIYYNITDMSSYNGSITVSPFKFGIDEDNNYGYFKDNEFILLPGQTAEYKWFDNGQLYNTDIFGEPVFRINDNGINNESSYKENGYIKLTCINDNCRGSGVESIVYTEYQIPTKYNRVKISFILHATREEDYLDFRFGINSSNDGLTNKNHALIYSPSFTAKEQLQEYELTIGSKQGYLFIGCCAVVDIYSVSFYTVT